MQLYTRKRISWSLKTVPNHIANDSSEFEIFFIVVQRNKHFKPASKNMAKEHNVLNSMLSALLSSKCIVKDNDSLQKNSTMCERSCDKVQLPKKKWFWNATQHFI